MSIFSTSVFISMIQTLELCPFGVRIKTISLRQLHELSHRLYKADFVTLCY